MVVKYFRGPSPTLATTSSSRGGSGVARRRLTQFHTLTYYYNNISVVTTSDSHRVTIIYGPDPRWKRPESWYTHGIYYIYTHRYRIFVVAAVVLVCYYNRSGFMWRGRRAINPGNIFLWASLAPPCMYIIIYTRTRSPRIFRLRCLRIIYRYIYITRYTRTNHEILIPSIFIGVGVAGFVSRPGRHAGLCLSYKRIALCAAYNLGRSMMRREGYVSSVGVCRK